MRIIDISFLAIPETDATGRPRPVQMFPIPQLLSSAKGSSAGKSHVTGGFWLGKTIQKWWMFQHAMFNYWRVILWHVEIGVFLAFFGQLYDIWYMKLYANRKASAGPEQWNLMVNLYRWWRVVRQATQRNPFAAENYLLSLTSAAIVCWLDELAKCQKTPADSLSGKRLRNWHA